MDAVGLLVLIPRYQYYDDFTVYIVDDDSTYLIRQSTSESEPLQELNRFIIQVLH